MAVITARTLSKCRGKNMCQLCRTRELCVKLRQLVHSRAELIELRRDKFCQSLEMGLHNLLSEVSGGLWKLFFHALY